MCHSFFSYISLKLTEMNIVKRHTNFEHFLLLHSWLFTPLLRPLQPASFLVMHDVFPPPLPFCFTIPVVISFASSIAYNLLPHFFILLHILTAALHCSLFHCYNPGLPVFFLSVTHCLSLPVVLTIAISYIFLFYILPIFSWFGVLLFFAYLLLCPYLVA